MDEYLIQGSTLTDIADAIREKTGDSALMTPAEMVEAIGSISGGTEITDGIVFTEVNENGYPIKADIYGDVPPYAFGYYNAGGSIGAYLESVTFKTQLSRIGSGAFQNTAITSIKIPDSVNFIGTQAYRGNSALAHIIHENARNLYSYQGGARWSLYGLSHLESMQLGAIGKPVTALYYQAFISSAPSTAVFTIYCIGNNVDAFLAAMRIYLTSQTIIFKASEATEYGGISYAAGDVILTSTP